MSTPTKTKPVRFHAGAFSIGTLRVKGQAPERIIRFALHHGQSIEVALSPLLAAQLGQSLLTPIPEASHE